MGFLEHFWRNSGKIFRPYSGIFVARPTSKSLLALVFRLID